MIEPSSYEGAIVSLNFLCGVTHDNRQYTFAEVVVTDRTDRTIDVSFFVPDASFRDEVGLVRLLGGSPVNDAMDAWNNRADYGSMSRHTATVGTQAVSSALSAEVSGCSVLAVLTIPRGPCVITCCWSFPLLQCAKVFVPTQNENMSGWRVQAILMQGLLESHGKRAISPLSSSFRFDLVSSQANVIFKSAEDATLVRRYGSSLPYHNLWVPLNKKAPDCRVHHSVCGAVLRDDTRSRLLNFYEVVFTAVPVVCGCFVRNTVSFPNSYIPLAVNERVTREGMCIFEDADNGTDVVIRLRGVLAYYIDLGTRETFSGVNWVSMRPFVLK